MILAKTRTYFANAVISAATVPKSNSGMMAIDAAISGIEKGGYGDVPDSLRDGYYGGAALKSCRAVHVNLEFARGDNIPSRLYRSKKHIKSGLYCI